MFTDTMKVELVKPLDPAHIVKPSGNFGPKGDYIEGWHCINELNRVFGFDGWSYTIDLRRDDLSEGNDSKGQPQWRAAYTCICTLTIGPVTRQDVGFGSGFAKGVGDAIEGATKEAVTDSLKRAARTFGNIFGLALYDKSRANVCAPPPATIHPDDVTRIQVLLEGNNIPVADLLKAAKVDRVTDILETRVPAVMNWVNKRIAPQEKESA